MKSLAVIINIIILLFSTKIYSQELQWTNIFQKYSYSSKILSIDPTSDGDYLVHIFHNENYDKGKEYIVKYSQNGAILTEDSIAEINPPRGFKLIETNDDTYLLIRNNGEVFEMKNSPDSLDLLFNLRKEGQKIGLNNCIERNNELIFTGIDNETKKGTYHIIIDVEQKMLVDSYMSDTALVSIDLDYFDDGDMVEAFKPNKIRKTNASKNIVWEHSVAIETFSLRGITTDASNNIYICGYQKTENSDGTIYNAVLYAMDENGNLLWQRILPPEASTGPYVYFAGRVFHDIDVTSSGNIIAAGEVGYSSDESPISNVFVCAYNIAGDTLWNLKHSVLGGQNFARQIIINDNDIIITGLAGGSDVAGFDKDFTMKITDLSAMVEDTMINNINNPFLIDNFKLYPNPGKLFININHNVLNNKDFTVEVLDLKGKKLQEYTNTKLIPIDKLNAGQYLIRVVTGQFIFSKKWVKVQH